VTALGALGSRLESLRALGAHVDYADPRVPQITVGGHRLEAVAWDTRYATGALGEFPHVVRL
jgi:hypothetical protein